MERDELKSRLSQQLRTLRDATDQKSAIAWMRDAYLLMESALRELDRSPAVAAPVFFQLPGLQPIVSTPDTKIYGVADSVLRKHPHIWLQGRTVEYGSPPPFVRPPLPEPMLLVERHPEPPPLKGGKKRKVDGIVYRAPAYQHGR